MLAMSSVPEVTQGLSVFTKGKRIHLPFPIIIRLVADRNYTYIYLTNGQRYLSAHTLSYFHKRLPNFFVRVNKSNIINKYHCLQITKNNSVYLTDQTVVFITRRTAKAIKQQLLILPHEIYGKTDQSAHCG
jgi:DNA-binding LytR/AlgR family response regulator